MKLDAGANAGCDQALLTVVGKDLRHAAELGAAEVLPGLRVQVHSPIHQIILLGHILDQAFHCFGFPTDWARMILCSTTIVRILDQSTS